MPKIVERRKSVMGKLTLNSQSMKDIEKRMEVLVSNGVKVKEEHSGEMNFSGCARGYCQAWD